MPHSTTVLSTQQSVTLAAITCVLEVGRDVREVLRTLIRCCACATSIRRWTSWKAEPSRVGARGLCRRKAVQVSHTCVPLLPGSTPGVFRDSPISSKLLSKSYVQQCTTTSLDASSKCVWVHEHTCAYSFVVTCSRHTHTHTTTRTSTEVPAWRRAQASGAKLESG